MIGINYLMLMLAILFMFVGNVYQSLYKDPFQKDIYRVYGAFGWYTILLAVLVICFAIPSVVGFFLSRRAAKRSQHSNSPHAAMPSPPEI